MLQVQMAFACEDVTSEAGGPVTFKNVMDGVVASDFPAPTGRWFAIFCFFSLEAQHLANCRVVIEHGKGELVAEKALKDVDFTPNNPISRNVLSFQGLQWPYPGGYLVKFLANGDDVIAYFPIWVQHAPPADADDERA